MRDIAGCILVRPGMFILWRATAPAADEAEATARLLAAIGHGLGRAKMLGSEKAACNDKSKNGEPP